MDFRGHHSARFTACSMVLCSYIDAIGYCYATDGRDLCNHSIGQSLRLSGAIEQPQLDWNRCYRRRRFCSQLGLE